LVEGHLETAARRGLALLAAPFTGSELIVIMMFALLLILEFLLLDLILPERILVAWTIVVNDVAIAWIRENRTCVA
jgi:hypothetical protein